MGRQIRRQIARLAAMMLPMLMIAGAAPAAPVVSTKAGVIQYTEGDVFLDGKLLRLAHYGNSQMENGQSLSTKNGRVELLLSPNTYLRLGENGSLRMEKNQLQDTQLVLEQGCALIEVVNEFKGNRVLVHLPTSAIEIRKVGLYRLDAGSREIRVYGGKALATRANRTVAIKKGRMARLDGDIALARFDANDADSLHLWAARRSFDLFDATKSTRKQQHWRLISKGWAHNFDYRMSFFSQRLFDEWAAAEAQAMREQAQAAELARAAAEAQVQAAAAATAASNPAPTTTKSAK